jgi:hypothetical protein
MDFEEPCGRRAKSSLKRRIKKKQTVFKDASENRTSEPTTSKHRTRSNNNRGGSPAASVKAGTDTKKKKKKRRKDNKEGETGSFRSDRTKAQRLGLSSQLASRSEVNEVKHGLLTKSTDTPASIETRPNRRKNLRRSKSRCATGEKKGEIQASVSNTKTNERNSLKSPSKRSVHPPAHNRPQRPEGFQKAKHRSKKKSEQRRKKERECLATSMTSNDPSIQRSKKSSKQFKHKRTVRTEMPKNNESKNVCAKEGSPSEKSNRKEKKGKKKKRSSAQIDSSEKKISKQTITKSPGSASVKKREHRLSTQVAFKGTSLESHKAGKTSSKVRKQSKMSNQTSIPDPCVAMDRSKTTHSKKVPSNVKKWKILDWLWATFNDPSQSNSEKRMSGNSVMEKPGPILVARRHSFNSSIINHVSSAIVVGRPETSATLSTCTDHSEPQPNSLSSSKQWYMTSSKNLEEYPRDRIMEMVFFE